MYVTVTQQKRHIVAIMLLEQDIKCSNLKKSNLKINALEVGSFLSCQK